MREVDFKVAEHESSMESHNALVLGIVWAGRETNLFLDRWTHPEPQSEKPSAPVRTIPSWHRNVGSRSGEPTMLPSRSDTNSRILCKSCAYMVRNGERGSWRARGRGKNGGSGGSRRSDGSVRQLGHGSSAAEQATPHG